MKTIHFIINVIMILVVSLFIFFMELFTFLWDSSKQIFKDAVANIKYAYSQKFD